MVSDRYTLEEQIASHPIFALPPEERFRQAEQQEELRALLTAYMGFGQADIAYNGEAFRCAFTEVIGRNDPGALSVCVFFRMIYIRELPRQLRRDQIPGPVGDVMKRIREMERVRAANGIDFSRITDDEFGRLANVLQISSGELKTLWTQYSQSLQGSLPELQTPENSGPGGEIITGKKNNEHPTAPAIKNDDVLTKPNKGFSRP